MCVKTIQLGATEPINTVVMVDSSGDTLPALSDVLLSIRRQSDGQYLDFDDNTFKASGWTTIQQTMSVLDATNSAGIYTYNWDTSPHSEDTYTMRIESATADNPVLVGELKVGGVLDRLLGLSHENAYHHTFVYSGGQLTSAKIDLYDSKANAQTHDGSTGIIAKYTATMTYSADNLDTFQVVRDS